MLANKRYMIIMVWVLSVATMLVPMVTYAVPTEETTSILIRKSARILTIYVNESPVYSFPVATGRGSNTPVGEFAIANKIKKPWYTRKNIPGGSRANPFGTRWLGMDVPNTGGYRYGIHGTNNPHSIGHNVTSGCIRMRNRDVEWLFRHVPIGTKVLIVE